MAEDFDASLWSQRSAWSQHESVLSAVRLPGANRQKRGKQEVRKTDVRAESRGGSRADPGITADGTAKIVILRMQRGIVEAVELPEDVRVVVQIYNTDGAIKASCLKMKTANRSH